MDSKHRHELMQNELADWIGKLPELMKQYRNQIIGVVLVIIGFISWPLLNRWRTESNFAAEAQVAEKIAAAELAKYMVMSAYSEPDPNAASANALLAAANNLADEAKSADNKDLAALALVKRGQSLRTDLLLKKEMIPQDVVSAQIKQAQEAYQEALDKAVLPSIRAMAQLGLGLCSEELGQLEQAKDMYKKIIDDATYAGMPFIKIARDRIDAMDDNNAKYTFIETPKPMISNLEMPQTQTAPLPAAEPNSSSK